MAINLPPLSNGLQQINTGIAPGDRQGDSLRTFATKVNENAAITLTENDNLAGLGLSWNPDSRKLSLNAPTNNLILGRNLVPINQQEFTVNSGFFSINQIDGSKITGVVAPSRFSLPNRTIPVGNLAGVGRPVALDPDEFDIVGEVLELKSVPLSKITGFQINSGEITLPQNNVLVGGSNNRARALLLAPEDFTITTDNKLALRASLDSAVTLDKIDAENEANPGNLLGVNVTGDAFRFVNPLESVEIALEAYVSLRGSVNEIYVNPEVGDDSLANPGTSPLTPFRSIQRALLEVTRNSYVAGTGTNRGEAGTDVFDRTVIRLAPGIYPINNAPGAPTAEGLTLPANAQQLDPSLYGILNSLDGGVIIPRGCSFVGSDLRKTKIYPTYVPDEDIDTPTGTVPIFRVTGGSYVEKLTFIDNPEVLSTHHRVTAIEFASVADLNKYYAQVYDMFRVIDNYSNVGGLNLSRVNEETEIVANTTSSTLVFPGTQFPQADGVYGSSPYIFNCSVRSRFGMAGALVDGSRVTGLKSMVAAQFTVISLQVDPNVFKPDPTNVVDGRTYIDHTYRNFGFAAFDDAYMQLVSCFVVGAANHYMSMRGGEISISNSTSNFGDLSLFASGASRTALEKDSGIEFLGIVPPKPLTTETEVITVGTLNARLQPRFSLGEVDTRSPETIAGDPSRINIDLLAPIAPYTMTEGNRIELTLRSSIEEIPNTLTLRAEIDLVSVEGKEQYFGLVINPITTGVTDAWLFVKPQTNQLHQFLTCTLNGIDILTAPEGQPIPDPYWYNRSLDFQPNGQPVTNGRVTREQQRQVECDRRVEMVLANTSAVISTAKVKDTRDEKDKFFRVILRATGNQRKIVENFLIDTPALRVASGSSARKNEYFVSDIVKIPETVAFEGRQTGILYSAYLLRANITDEDPRPDYIEDVKVSPEYQNIVNSLDATQQTQESLLANSISEQDLCLIAVRRFLEDLGYDSTEIARMTAPSAESENITLRTNIIIPKPGITVNNQLRVDFLKPSIIRASNHTWEWVGYRNYSTGLPKFQPLELPRDRALQAIQQAINGGRIYATGMNELGEFFIGNRSINLRTGDDDEIRFDSSVQEIIRRQADNQSFNQAPVNRNFVNLNVLNTLTADSIQTNNLLVKRQMLLGMDVEFQVSLSNTFSQPEPISDSFNCAAKATTSRYGLVRLASADEVLNNQGVGVVTASNLDDWGTTNLGIDIANRRKAVQLGGDGISGQQKIILGSETNNSVPVVQVGAQNKGYIFTQRDLGVFGDHWGGWIATNAYGRRYVSQDAPNNDTGRDGDLWLQLAAPTPPLAPTSQTAGAFEINGVRFQLTAGAVTGLNQTFATAVGNIAWQAAFRNDLGFGFSYAPDLSLEANRTSVPINLRVIDPQGMEFGITAGSGSTVVNGIVSSGIHFSGRIRLAPGNYTILLGAVTAIFPTGATGAARSLELHSAGIPAHVRYGPTLDTVLAMFGDAVPATVAGNANTPYALNVADTFTGTARSGNTTNSPLGITITAATPDAQLPTFRTVLDWHPFVTEPRLLLEDDARPGEYISYGRSRYDRGFQNYEILQNGRVVRNWRRTAFKVPNRRLPDNTLPAARFVRPTLVPASNILTTTTAGTNGRFLQAATSSIDAGAYAFAGTNLLTSATVAPTNLSFAAGLNIIANTFSATRVRQASPYFFLLPL